MPTNHQPALLFLFARVALFFFSSGNVEENSWDFKVPYIPALSAPANVLSHQYPATGVAALTQSNPHTLPASNPSLCHSTNPSWNRHPPAPTKTLAAPPAAAPEKRCTSPMTAARNGAITGVLSVRTEVAGNEAAAAARRLPARGRPSALHCRSLSRCPC